MKLKDFLNALPRGQKGVFAVKVGIDSVYLSQIASEDQGDRRFRPSPALSVRIEKASVGAVTRQEMRPEDWQEIWPELATEAVSTPALEKLPDHMIVEAITANLIKDRRVFVRRAEDRKRLGPDIGSAGQGV